MGASNHRGLRKRGSGPHTRICSNHYDMLSLVDLLRGVLAFAVELPSRCCESGEGDSADGEGNRAQITILKGAPRQRRTQRQVGAEDLQPKDGSGCVSIEVDAVPSEVSVQKCWQQEFEFLPSDANFV